MPIEIREVTIRANIHSQTADHLRKLRPRQRKEQMHEDLVNEIVDRVLAVLDQKGGR